MPTTNFNVVKEGRYRVITCNLCGWSERVEYDPPIKVNTGIEPELRAQSFMERHALGCNVAYAMVTG